MAATPRTVIMTVAFGAQEYLEAAAVMFSSLRAAGFRGECVCLSDQAYTFGQALEVRTVVAERAVSLKTKGPLLVARALELGDEDVLAMVDSDVLFAADPSPLFENASGVWCATTPYPLRLFMFNRKYMTRDEIESIPAERRCLNTGLMIFPVAEIERFCEVWAFYHESVRGPLEGDVVVLGDQPALEALVYRGGLQVARLSQEVMTFPTETSPIGITSPVLHFTGFERSQEGKSRLVRSMREWLLAIYPQAVL